MFLPSKRMRLLMRLKLFGAWRKQSRRLRTPTGVLFALVGLILFCLWIFSLTYGYGLGSRRSQGLGLPVGLLVPAAQLGLTVMTLMTLVNSLQFRGLFLPREELELLLGAPIERAELVRYRIWASVFRSLVGALLVGFFARRYAPVAGFAWVGASIFVLTLPLLGQLLSLVVGDESSRVSKVLPKGGLKILSVALMLAVGFGFYALFMESSGVSLPIPTPGAEPGSKTHLVDLLAGLLEHPVARRLTAPLRPWATMIMAESWGRFLPGLVFSVCFWLGLMEFCARAPFEIREASLDSSSKIARRLKRHKQGRIGASGSRASARTAQWDLPWLFGFDAFGALAWRKLTTILRKARGTALTAMLVLSILVLVMRAEGTGGMQPTFMLIGIGTLYLCGGLRFDFREDLERMDVIKSWPIPPAKAFLATILPEVILVSVLVSAAVLVRSWFAGEWGWWLGPALLAQPLLTLTWVALDNAVFLFSPVRFVPGQDGTLQHSGRMIVMLFLRMILVTVVAAVVACLAVPAYMLAQEFGWGRAASQGVAVTVGLLGLLGVDVILVLIGGRMLRRFDVARDRG